MKKIIFIFPLPALVLLSANAQINIDSTAIVPMISATYAYHFPGGDLVNRFGDNSSVGAAFSIKTNNNWIFGIDGNFLFGNNVKEGGILDGISTEKGEIIDEDGGYAEINFLERGLLTSFKLGKLFSFIGPNRNSGLAIIGSAGLLQHKIRIETHAPQLNDDYKKGYDRLTNGFALSEFIGYLYMGNKRMINLFIGFEFTQAWTQNRRSYNFEAMEKDETKRFDILSGIKIGWVIPFYKRVPDEYYYY
ncbi:MAG: hypothetical protein ABII90_04865 [Bacteroidota bacterium]